MNKLPFSKLFKKILGILLIALGIIGLFLPFLQGILFISIGLVLLENEKLKKFFFSIIGKSKKNQKYMFLLVRYLILLALMFSLPLIYKFFLPLTIYPVVYLLQLFYSVSVVKDIIIINFKLPIQIISACIAGSAYLLLLILNLSVPIKPKKRVYILLASFLMLLILNIFRIFFFSVLLVNDFKFFDFTHKFFWYVMSTFFVVLIWFLMVKLFSIKGVPVYTDIKSLINAIKRKN